MNTYLNLLSTILEEGTVKEPAREGMPSTKGIFGYQMRFNLADGFPLLTTKKMPPKTITHELIWFLKGDMNIKYLLDNNVHIWDKDAYRYYLNKCTKHEISPCVFEGFIASVEVGDLNVWFKEEPEYKLGDLGELYGAQWRNWNNQGIDQIKKVIDAIKKNPDGRRHIVSAWNPAEIDNMALPPCHCLFQFNCRKLSKLERQKYYSDNFFSTFDFSKTNGIPDSFLEDNNIPKYYLDLSLTQRSCDSFLGVPFNIASYSLLLEIVAKMCNMVAGVFVWNGNDVHIYSDHEEAVKTQLEREPMPLCKLKINDRVAKFEDISQIEMSDITFENYVSHPKIEANLSVGK